MSLFSKILLILIFINGIVLISLILKIRGILIKQGKEESYFMVSLISDLIQLKRISKREKGKYRNLINLTIVILLFEILLIILMIALL